MQSLDTAQKIKILKERRMVVPVMRAASEPFNPEKPTMFDSEITQENINVNQVINTLLGIIAFLMRELLMTGRVFPKDTWRKLHDIKKLVKEQKNTITGR